MSLRTEHSLPFTDLPPIRKRVSWTTWFIFRRDGSVREGSNRTPSTPLSPHRPFFVACRYRISVCPLVIFDSWTVHSKFSVVEEPGNVVGIRVNSSI